MVAEPERLRWPTDILHLIVINDNKIDPRRQSYLARTE